MSYSDVKIRDVSLRTGEWTPPVSAMGGPPAHELYTDLVLFAGLQLFRDARSRPWVVLRDGSQRRAFSVPSPELRSALDRFRMRRNVRPVPEGDIEEFVRVIEARVSDPDVEIPLLRAPLVEPGPVPDAARVGFPRPATDRLLAPRGYAPERSGGLMPALGRSDPVRSVVPDPRTPVRVPAPFGPVDEGSRPTFRASVSSAQRLPPPSDPTVARYVRVFRQLVRDGDWMGTTSELSHLTHEDAFALFDSLLRYRSELAAQGILIANVEVADGYRWLAVDRSRVRGDGEAESPDVTPVPAQ